MQADPLQHVDQVGAGIDARESAGGQQALDDADVLSPPTSVQQLAWVISGLTWAKTS
jgi:hypothetical protein